MQAACTHLACLCWCTTGSTRPVRTLIDYYIKRRLLLLLMEINSQGCTLPDGCINCRWACSSNAAMFWQPDIVAILLSQYYSVTLLCVLSQDQKSHGTVKTMFLDAMPPVSVNACHLIFMLKGSYILGPYVYTVPSECVHIFTHKCIMKRLYLLVVHVPPCKTPLK